MLQVNQADSHAKTPLYVATYHGRNDIVTLLLQADANVNSVDKNGKSPLYAAVLHGHLEIARKLLAAGASVNRPDREGLGPLHMAVKFPKLDIPMIKLLLSHGCDPVNLAGFTRWLLGHGIIPEECIAGDAELAEWLRREESSVRSLKRLCRAEIQSSLALSAAAAAACGQRGGEEVKGQSGKRAAGQQLIVVQQHLGKQVARLPIPEHLRVFVSMKAL